MNKQSGPIKIQATINDLTYYKRKGEYLVKSKSSVSSKRLKYSPEYAALRQHQQDFGLASTGGKLIRLAFAPLIAPVADFNCVSRLTANVLKVLQSVQANPSGKRNILDGDLNMLKGFEFNAQCGLSQVLRKSIKLTANAGNVSVSIEIPEFVPSRHLKSPQVSSHFQMILGMAATDFNNASYQSAFAETAQMPVKSSLGNTLSITCALGEMTSDPVLIVVGMRFSQLNSVVYEPVLNSGYQALSIVEVLKSGI